MNSLIACKKTERSTDKMCNKSMILIYHVQQCSSKPVSKAFKSPSQVWRCRRCYHMNKTNNKTESVN